MNASIAENAKQSAPQMKRVKPIANRSATCAIVAKNGRTRVVFTETAVREMDLAHIARNAIVGMPTSVSNRKGKAQEEIYDMKIVIG